FFPTLNPSPPTLSPTQHTVNPSNTNTTRCCRELISIICIYDEAIKMSDYIRLRNG
nr:hypothetical protein [Tanacetum cinerariifolium]